MSARAFRMPFWRIPLLKSLDLRFFSRRRRAAFANLFAPRKPRHPLLRLGLGLIGLALLLVLVALGVVIGALMISATLALRLWRQRRQAAPASRNLDAEYRVLRKPRLPVTPLSGSR